MYTWEMAGIVRIHVEFVVVVVLIRYIVLGWGLHLAFILGFVDAHT